MIRLSSVILVLWKCGLTLLNIALTFGVPAAFAQDSTEYVLDQASHTKQIKVNLYRGLDVDWWKSTLEYSTSVKGGAVLSIEDQYKIVLHQAPHFFRQWKHDHRLKFEVMKPVSDRASFGMNGSMDKFLDEGARAYPRNVIFEPAAPFHEIYIEPTSGAYQSFNDAQSSEFIGLGGSYRMEEALQLEGMLGPTRIRRSGVSKEGARFTAGMRGFLAQAQMSYSGDGWRDQYHDGGDHGLTMRLNGHWGDESSAQERFSADYSMSDRRDLRSTSFSETHRRDESLNLRNLLQTDIERSWIFSWESSLNRQNADHVGINVQFYELLWKNELAVNWEFGDWRGRNFGGVNLQEQDFSGGLSQGRRTWLGAGICLLETLGDSLGLEASAARYRFDTPDTTDQNDRDELQYRMELTGCWTLTPTFQLRALTEVDLHHLVYLYRSRSGENRWIRRFRFLIELPWREEILRNLARFSVTSVYTDFDYDPAKNDQSRVYRAFNACDSLTVNLSSTLSWSNNLTLLVDDHGRLLWDEWIQNVSERGYSLALTSLPTWSCGSFSAGGGWMWLRRFSHVFNEVEGSRVGEDMRAEGPVWVTTFNQSGRIQGEFRGRLLRFSDKKRGTQSVPDVALNIIWMLE